MNILLVYHELGFRGGEKLFTNLSRGLIKKGHKVYFVAGRSNPQKLNLPKNVKLISPSKFINKIFKNNWLFVFFSLPVTVFSILKIIKKVDVIYTGEVFTALWPSIIVSSLFKKKLLLSAFEIKKVSFVKNAVTINSSLIPYLKKSGVKNVSYIPPGIDFPKFKYTKTYLPAQAGKNIILMVGAIHPAKGQQIAIDAFKLVKTKIPDAVLIIAGGGDSNSIENLESKINNLNLNNSITVTGFVPENEINNYYLKSNVCLMCGPIGGLTIIESLYFGKNIIYPTSGNPPLGPVEEHDLGIVLSKNEPKLYAQKIIDILKYPKKYEAKLKKDRQKAIKLFSLNNFTKSTLHVLQKISDQDLV